MTDTQGATSSKGVREGGMSQKGATGSWGHSWKFSLYNFELQKSSKKKGLKCVFNVSFFSTLVWVAIAFLISLKGILWKNV